MPEYSWAHLIGDEWRTGEPGSQIEIVNPATEEVFARVPRATPQDARDAVRAARRAFDEGPWHAMSGKDRKLLLTRYAEALERHRDEIVPLVVAQGGCTISQARGMQVYEPIDMMYLYAELADRDPLQLVSIAGGAFSGPPAGVQHNLAVREPAGVVAAITAFNYPFFLNIQKIGPALAAGCTVVLKATETTCLDSYLLGKIALEECDFPPGVLNVLLGGGADVGQAMCEDPAVDQVTFVGSTRTGRRIMASAAETVKRVTLELGGKSANVVFADANLDRLLAGDAGLVVRHCGQGCSQLTRVLVEASVHDEVVAGMEARAEKVVVGDTMDASTEMGPLVNEAQYRRVTDYIASGISEGATLVYGGERPAGLDRGYFLQPTIFTDVKPEMRIFQEEIFGPVVVVTRFETEAEAIALANDSIFGLSGGVWSQDIAKALRVAGAIRTGSVLVNGPANTDKRFPAGGQKQSGLGRDYGTWAVEEYSEVKTIRYQIA